MIRPDKHNRKRSQTLSMSDADFDLLKRVADAAYDRNSSLAVRQMTREKARALGLVLDQANETVLA